MDNDTPRDQLEAPPKYVTPCEELEERNTWLRMVGFYLFHILYNSIVRILADAIAIDPMPL